jgi:tetratricopeptide (TPR) repeat protein
MKIILIVLMIIGLCSCRQTGDPIVKKEDLAFLLNSDPGDQALEAIEKELEFWQPRLGQNEMVAAMQLSQLYSKRFQLSADINDLNLADSMAMRANDFLRFQSASGFRALASVAISRHEFKKAETWLDSAYQLGDERLKTLLMQFDVALERGNHLRARSILDSFSGNQGFDVLIRRSRWTDEVEMDLGRSIEFMEDALNGLDRSQVELYRWSLSMLGDMYGHSGRYKDSYEAYLKVLNEDPGYFHCVRGLAWLAFSHDRDPQLARQIVNWLKRHYYSPEPDLLLAEIATFEADALNASRHMTAFRNVLDRQPLWKSLFRPKLFDLAMDSLQLSEALSIAQAEVEERPSPRSYSMAAYAFAMKGDKNKAGILVEQQIDGRSSEPDVMLRLSHIYQAIGDHKRAKVCLAEAIESGYELGPQFQESMAEDLKRKIK